MIDPEAVKLIKDIRISIQDAHAIMKVLEHHRPWEKALWPFFVSSEGAVPMLF